MTTTAARHPQSIASSLRACCSRAWNRRHEMRGPAKAIMRQLSGSVLTPPPSRRFVMGSGVHVDRITPARAHISYGDLGLAWLSLASGCTDVLTFLKLGDLFASAMTGNMALLALAIGRGQMLAASRSFTALLGFTLGAALATLIDARAQPQGSERSAPAKAAPDRNRHPGYMC